MLSSISKPETKPYTLHLGDCLEVLPSLPDSSVDAVVTDPPYGLSFMGKNWDHGVPGEQFWREVLRVAKPGAHLLAFGGTRTYHRLACAIEDAGWEVRDCLMWCHGQGFPKSADVSKMLDKHEQKQWLDVSKAIDDMPRFAIIEAWKQHSKTASDAGLSFLLTSERGSGITPGESTAPLIAHTKAFQDPSQHSTPNESSNAKCAETTFQKSETETGTNTPKSDFVPANVLLQANPENSDAVALVAELSLIEARRSCEVSFSSAQSHAESNTTESKSLATSVASQPASLEATLAMPDSSVLQSVWDWQSGNTADKLKAAEALRIWLGSKPSSMQEATSALCAALTDDLKLITLSQSKTFQSFDTTRQTDCVSAINAIITESTAANLISFTADTLRNKAINKAAGAEREVVSKSPHSANRNSIPMGVGGNYAIHGKAVTAEQAENWREVGDRFITAPATDAARQWAGWGTSLKPAWEPIILARKPLQGTVAENVLRYGTGGINVDGCRVGTGAITQYGRNASENRAMSGANYAEPAGRAWTGRWPANVIHDGSEEVVGLFPVTTSGKPCGKRNATTGFSSGITPGAADLTGYGDSGSAARFFYCAKASRADRNSGGVVANVHSTVKPTALMRYLCRLVTPPGGVVLDPFMGSGSTGKAAVLEGFRFIGIERDPAYIEIAKARILHAIEERKKMERELMQGRLPL